MLRSAVCLPLVVAAAWFGFVLGAFAKTALNGGPLPAMAWGALVSAATGLIGLWLAAYMLDRQRAGG